MRTQTMKMHKYIKKKQRALDERRLFCIDFIIFHE